MEKQILEKLMLKYPDMYKHLTELIECEVVDGKKIYKKSDNIYKVPVEPYNYWYDKISTYNTKLMFTMTLDPKFKLITKNIDQQKQFIDIVLKHELEKNNLEYIYTYEQQKNGNVHVHGIIVTNQVITHHKIQKIRSEIRKQCQEKEQISKIKKNRIITIEPIRFLDKSILYCLKEYEKPLFPYSKRLISNNSIKDVDTKKIKPELIPQLSLRSEDMSDCITVSFD